MVAATTDHPALSSPSAAVKKLMVLPTVHRLLVVLTSGAVVGYSLPELTPWPSAALTHINDITTLRHQRQRPSPTAANDDKIIAFTASKIRVMAVTKDHIQSLKDIAYSGSIKGVSVVGLSQNYSNLVLVANSTTYDVIDLQKTRKIPMGDYRNGDTAIAPFIEGYRADGDGKDEYMLTIRSEGTSAVAMFVDSLGDATRGTIIMDHYPSAVAVHWPFIYTVVKDQLVVYSLEQLAETTRIPIFAKEPTETTENTENTEENIEEATEENPVGSTANEEDPQGSDDEQTTNDKDDSKDAEPESEQPEATEADDANAETTEPTQQPDEPTHDETSSVTEVVAPIVSGVVSVDSLPFVADDRLAHVELVSGSDIPSAITKNHAHIAAFQGSRLWAVYEPDEFDSIIIDGDIAKVTAALDRHSGERHDYLLQHLVLQLLKQQQYEEVKPYLTRIKAGKLIVPPLMVIIAAAIGHIPQASEQSKHDENSDLTAIIADADAVVVTKGIRRQLAQLSPFPPSPQFVESYLKEVYKITPNLSYIRCSIYALLAKDDVDWVETDTWGDDAVTDEYCLAQLAAKQYTASLSRVYLRLDRITDYCQLSLAVLSSTTDSDDVAHVIDAVLGVLPQVTDEDLYSKVLVEVVKIDKQRGYNFLRSNRGHHHKHTNHKILTTLTDNGDGDDDDTQLLVLRLEYMEDSVSDHPTVDNARELFNHLVALIHRRCLDDDTVLLFDTVVQTYAIANAVSEPWPKSAWPDFVRGQATQSKISSVLTWYVKAYEAYVFLRRHGNPPSVPSSSMFAYFRATGAIADLLAASDYPQAEHVAVYGSVAPPTTPYYPWATSQLDPPVADPNRDDLKQILRHYLHLRPHTYSIPHFLMGFGSVFDPIDLLHILPATLNLVHVAEYWQRVLVELDTKRRQAAATKSLAKTEAKTTADIYRSLAANLTSD
ncbi:hypothetical protein DIURU_000220 [Diutina rugosa]|uniref:CNH domain-containing protein n=1 Tax=Diutina rugosa TaxID=5481 RepID=A0A642UZ38_DIURU|nr:uncharacterized protein DIURU_000220 [Diutina rugosa]KAA8908251.1 hypothetical protein DIURU_000220 [Diutina rugosa]